MTFRSSLILTLFTTIEGIKFFFRECPIYYEEPCDLHSVKFLLSTNTRSNIHLDPFRINLPQDFNARKPLKILIHGYGGLSIDRAIKNISQEYQQIGYNVITVDWEVLSAIPCYATAYWNTWHVGQCLAILLVSLLPAGFSPESLHLIGFSLGAHVAGFAGSNLKEVLNRQLGRITGLDPALPFFATTRTDWKLDPSDAKFVDVIHTSAGSFGKIEASGHVDFYVNGGVLQPECSNFPYPPICSHVMSGIYYSRTITNNQSLILLECDNIVNYALGVCYASGTVIMGEFVDQRLRGIYFVETAPENLWY